MPKVGKSFEEIMLEANRTLMKYEEMKQKIQTTQILIESVEENGEEATLQTLISLSCASSGDKKVEDMISLFPTMVAMSKFLKKIPSFEVDAETFERLIKDGKHFV